VQNKIDQKDLSQQLALRSISEEGRKMKNKTIGGLIATK
jgi:hypothetical protein